MKHQSAANTSLLLVFLSLSTWLQYQYLMECIILFKQVQRTSYILFSPDVGTSMSSPVFIFSYSRFTYNVVKQPWHANFTQNITEETTSFFFTEYFTDLEGRKEQDPSLHWDFYSSSLFGKKPYNGCWICLSVCKSVRPLIDQILYFRL